MPEKRLKRTRDSYLCEYCQSDGLYHGSPNYWSVDNIYNFCKWCNRRGHILALGLYGYQNNDPGLWKNITRSTEPVWRSTR